MALGEPGVLVRFAPIRLFRVLLIAVNITGLSRIQNVNIPECNNDSKGARGIGETFPDPTFSRSPDLL